MKKLLHRITLHPLYIKWRYHEFWPMFLFYAPVYVQQFWLALKARNLFFFLRTNPAIDGFILSDSKYQTLQLVPQRHLPKTILATKNTSPATVQSQMQAAGISFPVILKPNIGFRGLLVKKVTNVAQLQQALQRASVDYLIQEYIDFPLELGIFYYRLPNSPRGVIPSITLKEFLKVRGDGKHTLAELIYKNPRAILQAKRLKKQFYSQWNSHLPKGEEILLEEIGNHNRGTKFTNAQYLLDEALQEVFDALSDEMTGFYFGRFDIRTPSIEALKVDKNFVILEVNGVGAEPTHIYDPAYSLMSAWRELLRLWHVAYRIALQHRQNGVPFPSLSEGFIKWNAYRRYKKALSS